MSFEALGFIYEVAKDLGKIFEWKEVDKLVDAQWLEASGFRATAEANGYVLRWSRADRVASHGLSGYQVMFEFDDAARERRRLVLRDGSLLLGKPNS